MANSKDLIIRNFELTNKQRSIFDALKKISLDLSSKYLGAMKVSQNHNNPDRISQASHSLRELVNWLPRHLDLPYLKKYEFSKNVCELIDSIAEKWTNLRENLNLNNDIRDVDLIIVDILSVDIKEFFKKYFELKTRLQTQREILKRIITDFDMPVGGPPESVREITAKQWYNIHIKFTRLSHQKNPNESEFFETLYIFENILFGLLCPFYSAIDEIDDLITKDVPNNEDIEHIVALIKKQSHYEYFFAKLSSMHWLNPLKEKNFFEKPPNPIYSDNYIRFPIWPESRYLIKIADKKAKDVLQIIKSIPKTENFRIYEDFADALNKMPAELAKQVIDFARNWIKTGSKFSLLLPKRLTELIVKLIDENEIDASLELAEVILDIIIKSPPDISEVERKFFGIEVEAIPHFELWNYKEIAGEIVAKFTEGNPLLIIKLLEKLLAKVIFLENKTRNVTNKNNDFSFIWRPAVEDHEQNLVEENVKEILIVEIRDLLEKLGKGDENLFLKALSTLCVHKYSIFRRIELHIARLFPELSKDLIKEALSSKETFDNILTWHEYALLLRAQFPSLSTDAKERIFQWIEDGPDMERYKNLVKERKKETSPNDSELYKLTWQQRRLTLIEEFLPENWKVIYDKLNTKYGKLLYPEFLTYSTIWSGPISPLTKEELRQKTAKQILEYIVHREPSMEPLAPSPEGLDRQLHEEVKSRPSEFAVIAPEFFRRKLRPTYIHHLLSGLTQALRDNKKFNWGPVIILCEEIMTSKETLDPKISENTIEIGWRGVKKSIGNLLKEGLRNIDYVIPFNYKENVWSILEELAKDEDPTIEYETFYLGQSMDPLNLSINTVRGQAIHAILEYALWYARNVFPDGSEGSLPDSKMPPEVKKVLIEHLDISIEPTLTIRSIYGEYLPYIFYLDKNWVLENIDRIFPLTENEHQLWNAAWEAYIISCRLYEELYKAIKSQYKRALTFIGLDRSGRKLLDDPDMKFAEHMASLYWYGIESLHQEESLVNEFFGTAPPDVRGYAIKFLGRSIDSLKVHMDFEDILERLKLLWEKRITEASKMSTSDDFLKELQEFGWWFYNSLFDPTWTIDRLEETLELTNGAINPEHQVVKKLSEYVEDFPVQSLKCLLFIAKDESEPWNFYLWKEECRIIIQKAKETGDSKAIELSNELINHFGSKGIHDFRDLLN